MSGHSYGGVRIFCVMGYSYFTYYTLILIFIVSSANQSLLPTCSSCTPYTPWWSTLSIYLCLRWSIVCRHTCSLLFLSPFVQTYSFEDSIITYTLIFFRLFFQAIVRFRLTTHHLFISSNPRLETARLKKWLPRRAEIKRNQRSKRKSFLITVHPYLSVVSVSPEPINAGFPHDHTTHSNDPLRFPRPSLPGFVHSVSSTRVFAQVSIADSFTMFSDVLVCDPSSP